MAMKTETLLREIEAAFPDVEMPPAEELTVHTPEEDCWECKEFREDQEIEAYRGKKVTGHLIGWIHMEMHLLSSKGWLWILPHYLRYCLGLEDVTVDFYGGSTRFEFLVYHLGPNPESQEGRAQIFSAFSKAQLECLIHFLEWCKNHKFWSEYLPEEIERGLSFLSGLLAARIGNNFQ